MNLLRLALGLVSILTLTGGACGRGAEGRSKAFRIENPVVTVLPSHVGALYFSVVNPTNVDDRLLGVSSPHVGDAQLHEVVHDNGLTSMRPSAGFLVPAGQSLVLQHGGKHVMLFDVDSLDGELPLILHFERAGSVAFAAPIRSGLQP